MALFITVGSVGLLLLLSSLLLHDLLDGLFSSVEAISFDLDGAVFSGPVIGAFLAAFGLGGGLTASAGASQALAAVVGVGSGFGMGWVACRLTALLVGLTDEPPPRTTDLVGKLGTVITPVPARGFGEISVRHHGQLVKLNASAESSARTPIPRTTRVVILEVTSSSSVLVADEAALFGLS
jgi:hypothetical protein